MPTIDLQYYADLYYGGKCKENVKIYFLKEKEYEKKYKSIEKDAYGTADNDYENSLGFCLYSKKEDIYNILIKDCGEGYENAYILNLFHELSHVETLPRKTGAALFCSSGKKSDFALIGYEFWREYIAQYEAVNKYQMLIGDIQFLKDMEAADRVIKKLAVSTWTLYEAVLYSEITGVEIKGAERETAELINCLKQVKASFVTKEELKNIKKKELSKIGKCLIKVIDAIKIEVK